MKIVIIAAFAASALLTAPCYGQTAKAKEPWNMSVQELCESLQTSGQRCNIYGDPIDEEMLGPGPHTLVVSDGQGMTRFEYATGARCLRARISVQEQADGAAQERAKGGTGSIIGGRRIHAVCVPR
ncbi:MULTISPECIES: hypothetical protein [unclassified Sphingomonas]|uniref:hypothetical protein n=1 Tax=unclassified Sphingomonas TaxID=196159 RepID=UPI000BCD636F|nr:MAG: hypothetical protein B7Y98_03490 [Sphingomonas sp. 32-62-10]